MKAAWLGAAVFVGACGHHYSMEELFPQDFAPIAGPTGGHGGSDGGSTSSSITGEGGSGATGQGGATGSGGSGGASPECTTEADCPGANTWCGGPSCLHGACGMWFADAGTITADQVAGDCAMIRCDGAGHTAARPDPTDIPAGSACTTGACENGQPVSRPLSAGTLCPAGVCDGQGTCAECIDGSRCVSGVCSGGACQAPTCSDGVRNGTEAGVDCGGGGCPGCANGATCSTDADCASSTCAAGVCACGTDHLVISEVQTRTPADRQNEFIELYNPTAAAITLSNVSLRTQLFVLYTTPTLTIEPHAHFVIGGATYPGPIDGRVQANAEINDNGLVQLRAGAITIDSVCYCEPDQCPGWTPPASCEGVPIHRPYAWINQHSLARLPAGFNCQDTTDSATDFYTQMTPTPGAP